jgi:hypothetical protein
MPLLGARRNMNEDQANDIIDRLLEEDCFAENGRLGIYPEWLKHEDMQSLVSTGVFREEHGGPDTYGHTDYYLNPCCEKIGLSNNCTWPNCMHFHFQKSGITMRAPDLGWTCGKCKTQNRDGDPICGFCDNPRLSG